MGNGRYYASKKKSIILDLDGVTIYPSFEDDDKDKADDADKAEDAEDTDDADSQDTESTDDETETEETTDEGGDEDSEEDSEASGETTEAEEDEGDGDGVTAEDEKRAEEHRFFRTDSEEPEFNQPDEERKAIKDYLEPLIGEGINDLTLYTSGEVNRPLYHVSMNPNIPAFTPKVSRRTLSSEDRSLPRISTSTSLIGCMNGYQSMVSDMDGREAKKFTGIFKVYSLPYQYAIKPSKRLLADVDNSDEYWLISWKKETYSTVPVMVADFTIPKIESVYGSDGIDKTFHVFIKVLNDALYLDHERKLTKGCYHVTLRGYNFKYPLRNNQLITVEPISENDYNRTTSLSMMIKKR